MLMGVKEVRKWALTFWVFKIFFLSYFVKARSFILCLVAEKNVGKQNKLKLKTFCLILC